MKKAKETMGALTFHGTAMAERQKLAASMGEIAQWNRSFRAMEVLAAELKGRLALAGPPAGHGSAFNWFRAAADRQRPASMLNAPPILTPMAMRLGDYFIARNLPAVLGRAAPGDPPSDERVGEPLPHGVVQV